MFTPATLEFLWELSTKNSRDWFNPKKSRHETALKAPATEQIGRMKGMLERLEMLTRDSTRLSESKPEHLPAPFGKDHPRGALLR